MKVAIDRSIEQTVCFSLGFVLSHHDSHGDARPRAARRPSAAGRGHDLLRVAFTVPVSGVPTHVLGAANLPDTADLARLRATRRGMRRAAEETARTVKELSTRRRAARMVQRASAYATARTSDERKLPQRGSSEERIAGGVEVATRERLPVEQVDALLSGEEQPIRGAEVCARERMAVRGAHVDTRCLAATSSC